MAIPSCASNMHTRTYSSTSMMKLKNIEENMENMIEESILRELDLFIINNKKRTRVTVNQDYGHGHGHNDLGQHGHHSHSPVPVPVDIFRKTKSGKFVLVTPRDTCSMILVPVVLVDHDLDDDIHITSINTNNNNNQDELLKNIEMLERQVQILSAANANARARNIEAQLSGVNVSPPLPQLSLTQLALHDAGVGAGPSGLRNSPEELEDAGDYSINGKIESEEIDGSRFPFVSLSDLSVLEKWSHRNAESLESDYGIERSDRFLSDVLFVFNPTVKIERWMFLDPRDGCDYRNRIRQEEFAKELGLIHVNDKMLTAQSRRSFRRRKAVQEVRALVSDRVASPREDSGDKNRERPETDRPKSDDSVVGVPKSINRLYSEAEDRIIIKWVLEEDRHNKVHGNVVWKEIEQADILPMKRSWQSLRQRYRKIILSNLRAYGLTHAQETKLKIGAEKGMLNRNKKVFDSKYKLSKSFIEGEKKKSPKEKQGKSNSPKTIIKYKLNTPLTKLSHSKSKNKMKTFRKLFTQKSFQ